MHKSGDGAGGRRGIKALDAVLILVFAAAIGLSVFIMVKGGGDAAPRMFVKTPDGRFVYSLEDESTYRFKGLLGETTVEISDGAARITSSPCPNKTCIQQGSITRPGQWIACLPNGVIIYIENSDEEDGTDADTL